ncbi:hypothetical protein TW95_gp1065 [Pandoravirus inopinatum]|uniref:Uncharacterized protein n=1 Tax=Pandoravirus inopinatum TaxID=1605721 RepID=A0A0B5J2L1_9VIRU|nr:hypothetical protein TW95_gp1065 [Pandoravirus inopinatum]AJF97799.1 hypothetical protein [Pandoravirus inopinatum]
MSGHEFKKKVGRSASTALCFVCKTAFLSRAPIQTIPMAPTTTTTTTTTDVPTLCGFPTPPARARRTAPLGLATHAHSLVCVLVGIALWSALASSEPPVCQLVAAAGLAAVAVRIQASMRRATVAMVTCGHDVGSTIHRALDECAPKAKVMFSIGDAATRAVCLERDPTADGATCVHLFVMETACGVEAVYDREQVSRMWPGILARSGAAADPIDTLFSSIIVPENDGRIRVTVHRAVAPVDQHEPFMTDAGRMDAAVERIRLSRPEPKREKLQAVAVDPSVASSF